MTIFRSELATPTVFQTESNQGINYITNLGGGVLLAALRSDGLIKSTDFGVSWGSPFGLGQGGPWQTIYSLPVNPPSGSGAAGRIIAIQTTPSGVPITKTYYSDDGGLTFTVIAGSITNTPFEGMTIVQRTDPLGSGFVYFNSIISGGIVGSSDGGESWASVSSTTLRGRGVLTIINSGAMVASGNGGVNNLVKNFYTASVIGPPTGGTSYTDALIGTNQKEVVSDYHSGDDIIATAFLDNNGEWALVTSNSPDFTSVKRFTSSTGGIITGVRFITAISNIPQKFAVVTLNSAGLYQLWVSADNDFTTFTVDKTSDINITSQGAMSNFLSVNT